MKSHRKSAVGAGLTRIVAPPPVCMEIWVDLDETADYGIPDASPVAIERSVAPALSHVRPVFDDPQPVHLARMTARSLLVRGSIPFPISSV